MTTTPKAEASRFRFRAWDIENKQWAIIDIDNWSESIGPNALLIPAQKDPFMVFELRNSKQFVWMQSTGLTDKNGKEIWQGDILREREAKRLDVIGAVDFKDGMFCVQYFKADGRGMGTYAVGKRLFYKPEIIGNIYEHPHLLSPSK